MSNFKIWTQTDPYCLINLVLFVKKPTCIWSIHKWKLFIDTGINQPKILKLQHSKMNKKTGAPRKDSDQSGNPPSLIRVFTVCSIGSQGPKTSSSRQWRLWSDCTDVQADRSFVGFVALWHICLIMQRKGSCSGIDKKRIWYFKDNFRQFMGHNAHLSEQL